MHLVALLLWLSFLSTLPFCLSFYHQHQASRGELFRITSLASSFESNLPSMGGRIENAFAAAKERHEAAFVTFVTAGYPSAKGKRKIDIVQIDFDLFLTSFSILCFARYTCYFAGYARRRRLCD